MYITQTDTTCNHAFIMLTHTYVFSHHTTAHTHTYIYTHTFLHTYTHTHIHTHTHTHTHTHKGRYTSRHNIIITLHTTLHDTLRTETHTHTRTYAYPPVMVESSSSIFIFSLSIIIGVTPVPSKLFGPLKELHPGVTDRTRCVAGISENPIVVLLEAETLLNLVHAGIKFCKLSNSSYLNTEHNFTNHTTSTTENSPALIG